MLADTFGTCQRLERDTGERELSVYYSVVFGYCHVPVRVTCPGNLKGNEEQLVIKDFSFCFFCGPFSVLSTAPVIAACQCGAST
eukprot:COSAG05_NODE_683_length_7951_cov_18.263500_2_plen_84_part_00